jgi:SAM-dependent methyltransferase
MSATSTDRPTPKKQKPLLVRLRDTLMPGYRARRDAKKRRQREAKFASERWQRGDAFAHRNYASYDEYLAHQAEKLERIYERRQIKDEAAVAEFRRRFEGCAPLAAARNVLCLGARLGAEVRALRELGYFAVGLDLNPGRDNPYVFYGDFHDLAFRDASVDAVYTNALDHVFDLARVVKEVDRVLAPGGLFVADVLPGSEEGFIPGEYEATHWRRTEDLVEAVAAAASLTVAETRNLGRYNRDPWQQVVFVKP